MHARNASMLVDFGVGRLRLPAMFIMFIAWRRTPCLLVHILLILSMSKRLLVSQKARYFRSRAARMPLSVSRPGARGRERLRMLFHRWILG